MKLNTQLRREAACPGGCSLDDSDQQESRRSALVGELADLKRRSFAVEEELSSLEMLQALNRYTCSCVNLNSKMGIHDMAEQELRGRIGLQLGVVSETLSAARSCPDCGGSGVPRR